MRLRSARVFAMCCLYLLLATGFALPDGARADETADQRVKIALVFGLSGYRKAERLPNPINDAVLVAERLKAAGFKLHQAYDSTRDEMRAAIDGFVAAAKGADIALVYYAGHAMQIRAENYLVPVDFDPAASDVLAGLVPVSDLVKQLAVVAKARVLLLDACRDNPFAIGVAATLGANALGRGLAPITIPATDGTTQPDGTHGLVIGYATQPDQTADDGEYAQGPYAAALAHGLRAPEEDLHAILLRTSFAVVNATRGAQHPEHRVALTQPLYLVARKAPLPCDVLAVDEDNNIGIKAVPFDEIVGGAALEACQLDLKRIPGNPRLNHNLGRVLDKIGRDGEAVAQFRIAANAGFAPAQNDLSVMLMNGEGVDRDFEAGLKWLSLAASQGFRRAIANYSVADMAKVFRGNRQRVEILQRGLQRAGAANLQATGQLDDATLAALEKFKSERGHKGALISLQTIHELAIAKALASK